MKAILMSIRPEWVAKILNGEKTIEVRKKFPKDFKGWVYIYCTKDKWLLYDKEQQTYFSTNKKKGSLDCHSINSDYFSNLSYEIEVCEHLEGKVVARFWCDKVEEIDDCFTIEHIDNEYPDTYELGDMEEEQLLKECCLTKEEMNAYYKGVKEPLKAIHITNLEIFGEPKELSEFRQWFDCEKCWCVDNQDCLMNKQCPKHTLTRAPQSWCYVEV